MRHPLLEIESGVSPANQTKERPGKPNQTKGQFMNFSGDKLEQKFDVNRACFPKEKRQNSHKHGREIHELFVLALFLVWFAGAPLIECFRGRHRGGRHFTAFLRFSGPFFSFLASKWAFSAIKLAPPWREPPEAPLEPPWVASCSSPHRAPEAPGAEIPEKWGKITKNSPPRSNPRKWGEKWPKNYKKCIFGVSFFVIFR